jgi:hypothetical protein
VQRISDGPYEFDWCQKHHKLQDMQCQTDITVHNEWFNGIDDILSI